MRPLYDSTRFSQHRWHCERHPRCRLCANVRQSRGGARRRHLTRSPERHYLQAASGPGFSVPLCFSARNWEVHDACPPRRSAVDAKIARALRDGSTTLHYFGSSQYGSLWRHASYLGDGTLDDHLFLFTWLARVSQANRIRCGQQLTPQQQGSQRSAVSSCQPYHSGPHPTCRRVIQFVELAVVAAAGGQDLARCANSARGGNAPGDDVEPVVHSTPPLPALPNGLTQPVTLITATGANESAVLVRDQVVRRCIAPAPDDDRSR